jgi:hypothetical protein
VSLAEQYDVKLKQRHGPEGPRTRDGVIISARDDGRLKVDRGDELVDEHSSETGSGTRVAPQGEKSRRTQVYEAAVR